MRRLPAAQPLMVVKGRFLTQPTGAHDPERPVVATEVQRQVSGLERAPDTDAHRRQVGSSTYWAKLHLEGVVLLPNTVR